MRESTGRRFWLAAAAVGVGLLAIVVLTSLVTAAVNAGDTVRETTALRQQIDVLQEQADARAAEAEQRSANASKDRARLERQNERLRRQLDALLEFLAEQGVVVPAAAGGESGSAPAPPVAAREQPARVDPPVVRAESPRPARPARPSRPAQPPVAPPVAPSQPDNPALLCVLRICVP